MIDLPMIQADMPIRTVGKQGSIYSTMRGRITEGLLAPGARLPRRTDLESEFSASRVTIQRVFDKLLEDGFVRTNGRGGTFVVDHPPHHCRFALVFGGADQNSLRFWSALDHEARLLSSPRRSIVTYANVISAPDSALQQERLLADLRAHRLAGVIWTTFPGSIIVAGPLVQERLAPSVAIMVFASPFLHGVSIDSQAFMERAIDHLVAHGRRRIALLTVPGHSNEHFCKHLRARGLEFRPYWRQMLPPDASASARSLVHLLFRSDHALRPDALIIADDNLVEEATAGLIAAGIAVPRDVTVVAHCNFPWPTPSAVPAHRLGYDARAVLERCLVLLASGPASATPPAPLLIAPVFDHERATDAQRQP